MKCVLQKVSQASVLINSKEKRFISKGYVILVGFSKDCTEEKLDYMVRKILSLRVFESIEKGFDLTIEDIKGELLIISQFTLFGDCTQGAKPKFNDAMEYSKAQEMYELFLDKLKTKTSLAIKTGEFGAKMEVNLTNNGPVTLILEK